MSVEETLKDAEDDNSGSNEQTVDRDFIDIYRTLPEKAPVTIRLFERGDYYTFHGEDAIYASKELFQTSNAIKYWKSDSGGLLETCNLSKNQFEEMLRKLLLVKQYRVEIWNRKQRSTEWTLAFHGSPGNLSAFEDILFSSSSSQGQASTGVMACKLATEDGQTIVGIALIDVETYTMKVCEVNVTSHYSNLESILVQLGPKECLLPSIGATDENYLQLKKIIEKSQVLVTERPKNEFTSKDIVQDLTRLLTKRNADQDERRNIAALTEVQKVHAMCSLTAAIKFLQLLSDDSQFNRFSLKTHQCELYMRLDTAATIALHVFPDAQQDYSSNSKCSSLYSLLNRCRTAQGQRLLRLWLMQPLTDQGKLNERLDIVELFISDVTTRTYVSENFLSRVPDFLRLLRKFIKKKASLHDCYKIYSAISHIPKLIECLEHYDGNKKAILEHVFIQPLKELVSDFEKYCEMIEKTIDLDRVQKHEYIIKPDFDEDLKAHREKMSRYESDIQSDYYSICEDLEEAGGESGSSAKKKPRRSTKKKTNNADDDDDTIADSSGGVVKLEYDSKHNGYYYRIARKDESCLRQKTLKYKYQTLATKKEGVYFRSKRLEDLNEHYMTSRIQYDETQKALVDEVLQICLTYMDSLRSLLEILSELDCFISLAQVSAQYQYVRPKFSEENKIHLEDSRHPCVELQENMQFISNNVTLDREKQRFLIITGPNMGGKSTYIRQVGVIMLMAQIGCYVPCSSAEISIVDCILARIGSNDDLSRGVSTFMSEMLEMSTILDIATQKSLLIIDELGRGTSTYDGFGLAWAVADYICKQIQCYCLFATHFHELTLIEQEMPEIIENLHVDALADEQQLTLLYKIKQGVCDQSFGIHVAQLAQFPKHVIQFAQKRATELEEFTTTSSSKKIKAHDNKENIHTFASSESVESVWKDIEALKTHTDLSVTDAKSMIDNILEKATNLGLL